MAAHLLSRLPVLSKPHPPGTLLGPPQRDMASVTAELHSSFLCAWTKGGFYCSWHCLIKWEHQQLCFVWIVKVDDFCFWIYFLRLFPKMQLMKPHLLTLLRIVSHCTQDALVYSPQLCTETKEVKRSLGSPAFSGDSAHSLLCKSNLCLFLRTKGPHRVK